MANNNYTFAVARIRAMEVSLFNKSVIDQLMACRSYDESMRFLEDKGWGNGDGKQEADQMLSYERAKIWETVEELGVPMDTFEVLSFPNAFHNLKTAIKEAVSEQLRDEFFFDSTVPSRDELREIVKNKDFGSLPKSMEAAAKDAYETLMHSGDGQLCDVIIDRACLEAILKAAEDADEVIQTYAQITVAVANIKIAVRCQKTNKSFDFMMRALTSCQGMQPEALAKASLSGFESLCSYLESSGYGKAAEALKVSPSAFERWCDNYLIEMLKPQKFESFSAGPIVAYIIARENEIKTVGIILSGKRNSLPETFITERIREMYV
ncbi:V-type sodium pump subunit C [uncultured Roseburia sp.]|uniref:V-type ATPase subunit n=1 Tax=Brotonthovivens ammoniilytica TaxID=2981725 RepID=A0ABT2TMA4_9FIRM|nr:V-type ATPase subunit [Brotonthovivens ammoniilytica]MCU6762767.1 V-type ATPase subunit [Brotonthovivens ammoniilytica]SCI88040.1 V-type sodium pump subunit C [uncultured Roseburia sp.]